MDKITFPIFETKKNQIVDLNGGKSYFYELVPPDLCQKSSREIDNFIDAVGSRLNILDEDGFFKFYWLGGKSYLNTNYQDVHLPETDFIPCKSALEIFFGSSDIFSDVGIYDDYVSFNGHYKRILSVMEFGGDEIDVNFLPKNVDYILSFKKKPKDKALSKLERIRNSHLSSFLKPKRDIESEGAYQQAEELIGDLTNGFESLFKIELYFLVSAFSLDDLNQKTISFIENCRSRGIKLFIEGQSFRKLKTGLATIFSELIPGVRPSLSIRQHTDKTSHLKYLLPLHKSHLMDEGISLLDEEGKSIFFDPFSSEVRNRNMLVTGSSGSGKSVFINKLIHNLIEKHPTVILDKGGSFKRLTKYHEGVELSQKINPMQFGNPIFLREIILSCVDKGRFNKLERGRLLKSIREILSDGKKLSFWSLLLKLEEEFAGISLYFEDLKHVFGEEEIKPTKILYVDVEDYPKEAVSPLILFLLEYFKNLPEKEKVLVFDECWSFLRNHVDYIDECFRTFRKNGALPIAISQGLKDFSGIGELYNSISNNSYFKVFFPQEYISDSNFDEFDNQMISSLAFEKGHFSECYLKSSDNKYRKIIRIELSALELELFHTEAGQDDPLNRFYQDNRSYFSSNKETIDSFVRLKYAQA